MRLYAVRHVPSKLYLVRRRGSYVLVSDPHFLKRYPTLPKVDIRVIGQGVVQPSELEVASFLVLENIPAGTVNKNGQFNHRCNYPLKHLPFWLEMGKRVAIKIENGRTIMDVDDV